MRWLKLDCRMMRDGRIMRLSWSDRTLWVGLLALAREQDSDTIQAAPGRGYTPHEIAVLLTRLDPNAESDTAEGLAKLVEQGLIRYTGPGDPIVIPNFLKWQGLSPSESPMRVRERVQKHRQHRTLPHRLPLRNRHVTGLKRDVTGVEERREDKKRQDKSKSLSTATHPQDVLTAEHPSDGSNRTLSHKPSETTVHVPATASPARTASDIQQVADHYAEVKRFAPEDRNLVYPRLVRSARALLKAAGGDVALVQRGIDEIGAWLNRQGLDTWTLDAVVRNWPQWRAEERAEAGAGTGRVL